MAESTLNYVTECKCVWPPVYPCSCLSVCAVQCCAVWSSRCGDSSSAAQQTCTGRLLDVLGLENYSPLERLAVAVCTPHTDTLQHTQVHDEYTLT